MRAITDRVGWMNVKLGMVNTALVGEGVTDDLVVKVVSTVILVVPILEVGVETEGEVTETKTLLEFKLVEA